MYCSTEIDSTGHSAFCLGPKKLQSLPLNLVHCQGTHIHNYVKHFFPMCLCVAHIMLCVGIEVVEKVKEEIENLPPNKVFAVAHISENTSFKSGYYVYTSSKECGSCTYIHV